MCARAIIVATRLFDHAFQLWYAEIGPRTSIYAIAQIYPAVYQAKCRQYRVPTGSRRISERFQKKQSAYWTGAQPIRCALPGTPMQGTLAARDTVALPNLTGSVEASQGYIDRGMRFYKGTL